MPGTLATFSANSVISVVSVSGSGPSRLTQTGRSKPNAELDARHRLQLLADRAFDLLLRPGAVAAVDELQVDARVVATLFRADRRHRQRNLGNAFQHGFDLLHLAVRVFEARTDRRVEPQRDEPFVGLGDELRADQRHDREAGEERDERDGDHALAMAERPLEDRSVQHVNPLDPALDAVHEPAEPRHAPEPRSRRIVPDGRQHRVERERDEQRDEHRHGDGDAELEEEAADDAAHECDRHEHRDDRERGGHHGEADFVGPLARRPHVVLPLPKVTNDVLAHDDRVVDEEADAQGQRHQRQEIQRESETRSAR